MSLFKYCIDINNRKPKWDDLYPSNPSLSSEFRRLFNPLSSFGNVLELDLDLNDQMEFNVFQSSDISDEFKCNGIDYDVFDEAEKQKRGIRPIFKSAPPTANSRNKRKGQRECVFCRNNGETKDFCQTHLLKDRNGKVTCPVLRAYVCPICGTSGDTAHTIKYCPKNRNKEHYEQLIKFGKIAKPDRRLVDSIYF